MPYLQPLRDKPVVFGYRERSIPWREEITLDLSEEDVKVCKCVYRLFDIDRI